MIAIVLQKKRCFFSTTVREKIAYGRQDADRRRNIDAARRAKPTISFDNCPNGYASLWRTGLVHLSVGHGSASASPALFEK